MTETGNTNVPITCTICNRETTVAMSWEGLSLQAFAKFAQQFKCGECFEKLFKKQEEITCQS